MTDNQVAFWLVIMLFAQVYAIGLAFIYVFPNESSHLHILQKLGFTLLVFGLVVQIIRSVHYLNLGHYPIDVVFPMWVTKDLGACLLIYYYAKVHKN